MAKKQDKTAPSGPVQKTAAAALAESTGPVSRIRGFTHYLENARAELEKVSWPIRKEVQATSLAVLALVVIMAIFLGLADILLSKIMEAILSIAG
ncbi:MAG: preprotein translocase subunit SecE [Desulfovibrio sp.]|nr:preprotein translocase subunit SecE [Desulfovibrio sp.]